MRDLSGFTAICASLAAPNAGYPRAVIQLLTANIRQHLTPVLATRSATNQCNALRLNATGMYDIHAIRQRISHAFQYRACQFCGAVLMGEAEENALCLWIIVRRALAGKIRQNQTGSTLSSACWAAAIKAGTSLRPVNFVAQSRHDAALNITDIKCQRSGKAWQSYVRRFPAY